MGTYKCAAGVLVEVGQPCPRCGADEDTDEGCLGARDDFERRLREAKQPLTDDCSIERKP